MIVISVCTHISIRLICQSVYYQLHNIRQIQRFLTYNSTKLLVEAVITARIDDCNGLLHRVPAGRYYRASDYICMYT